MSLSPAATSILCAVGARNSLAGVTKWCALVAPVKRLPALGDCWHGDAADVLRLRPDVVIGGVPYKQETVAKLLAQPITFLAMNPRTLTEIHADIRILSRLVDRHSAGERLIARMKSEFEQMTAKQRAREPKPRVYCEAWPNPRISSPPWVAEIVQIAGGEMVVPPGEKVSDEQVAGARPDIIVLAWAAAGAKSEPRKAYAVQAWHDAPAIRNRRVYVVRDELLNTPGPPLMKGAKALFEIFHSRPARGANR